ncbi:elongation factor P--(R)-beta-lysine ligase [Psychrosphaera aestuarii]|uniref:elongation factor P--(R)-beta-lysine ligase n=1 Tax=Psychrosphaera aestuarii TaxID=1266052 RepID=UPI001B322BC3|nr:elongation factor P--(R)-beta-lysine ligase [Psychrosphaera aestuarii]
MWQPSSSIETLKQRAKFINKIRQFFMSRDVLEVDTPLLSHGTVTDVHLDAFSSEFFHDNSGQNKQLFLQTSPEFAMKRLLSAGSGSIYQICKAFRNESPGRLHNPEFTMLEWYRVDYDEHELMDEVDALLKTLLGTQAAIRISYQTAFQNAFNIELHTTEISQLKALVLAHSPHDDWVHNETNKDTLLQWLFSVVIEPTLGAPNSLYNSTEQWCPCFVYDFPASQAALARINKNNSTLAHRFELYFKGIELANGYYELQSEQEQLMRFTKDNEQRALLNKPVMPIDKNLIDALKSGFPNCAGVALGVDRLFLLSQQKDSINEVISFAYSRC